MGTAMFTGITGLLAHQRRLDVVANNIANVNTTGYRGARVLFQDLFSQTLEGGVAPSGNFGGTNPEQVGLGAGVASIDVDHAQGSLITTGAAADMAIQGNGFFVLSDGATQFFTRDGSFALNSEGVLIDPATGRRVQGYMADQNGVIDSAAKPTDITIPLGTEQLVRATENVVLTGNLSSDTASGDTVQRTIRVYDSLGTARDIELTLTKQPATGQWQWAGASSDPDIQSVTGTGTVTFDANGDFQSVSNNQVTVNFAAGLPAMPANPLTLSLDFNELTQLAGDSDMTMASQDGYERGTLAGFNIARNGIINGIYTNGLMQQLGQVAVGTFTNVGGLNRAGNNSFLASPSSGPAQIGLANTGGRGEVSGGTLEQSNVDLGTEFSNMIITQRGFQANARTITAADTLLQETVNLVR